MYNDTMQSLSLLFYFILTFFFTVKTFWNLFEESWMSQLILRFSCSTDAHEFKQIESIYFLNWICTFHFMITIAVFKTTQFAICFFLCVLVVLHVSGNPQ